MILSSHKTFMGSEHMCPQIAKSVELQVPDRPDRPWMLFARYYNLNILGLCPQFSGRAMSFMTVTSTVGLNIALCASPVSSA